MKVALIHDWLVVDGGAENVLEKLKQMFPAAHIYTSVFDKKTMGVRFNEKDVRTSFVQKLPFAIKKYMYYLNFMPYAFENFDLSEYDLIISSSYCCAKGVITRPHQLHICYCHTPMRFAWDFYYEYFNKVNWFIKLYIKYKMKSIREWDVISSNRVDYFIANSSYVASRIKKYYRRDAVVINPPVDTEFYNLNSSDGRSDFYLSYGRLVAYKRIDLVIDAFNQNGKKLIIIGDGEEYKKLKKMAKDNIIFLGKLKIEIVREYFQKCKAFIFPGEEDFGITVVEAQACGTPVIAYGRGGARETVIENINGIFFEKQDAEELNRAIERFEAVKFDSKLIRENAAKFSQDNFCNNIHKFVFDKLSGKVNVE